VRESKLPSERDWERADVLEPRAASRYPELLSDGAALAFAPAALDGPPGPLDPADPAAGALLAYLVAATAPKRTARTPWKRGAASTPASLDGWRLLARTDNEVLFARGRLPHLLTVSFRKKPLRRTWTCLRSSAARPLRATRDGIRASSWRLDPMHELQQSDTVLRVLLTEQAFASGQRADGRVLTPDLYADGEQLVLRVFVTPRPGYQTATRNPETPVRIALPHPVGARRVIDGALPYPTPPPGAR
jgi:hypothetical protein